MTTDDRLQAQFLALDGVLERTKDRVPTWELDERSWLQHVDGGWRHLTLMFSQESSEHFAEHPADGQLILWLLRSINPVRACGSRKFAAAEAAFMEARK